MRKLILLLAVLALLLCCGCGETTPDATTQAPTQAPTQGTEGPHAHADRDDNGICDGCDESVMTTIDVYSINDLHGKVLDGDNHPGVDELTTYLKNAAETDDNAIFVAAGDMWQGAPESNLTQGLFVTDWMNELGFAAGALGNHDFDWGEEPAIANSEAAEFPFLAINVYDRATQTRVDYCDASVLVEANGVQVGIIGAMGDCYSSIAPDKVEDIYFINGKQLTELVKAEADQLRSNGADFIVYVIHDGYGDSHYDGIKSVTGNQLRSYYDTALSDGYVDVVFEGHTHQGYVLQDEYGVFHLQNRGDNKGGISHVEVYINTVTGTYNVTKAESVNTSTYTGLDADPVIESLEEKYADQIAQGMEVLGSNRITRNSQVLSRLVAKLYYELGEKTWSDEYDVVLGGGFISTRSPYSLAIGEVTYGDLQCLFPFDNDLVLCSVKGSVLLGRFINTDDNRYSAYLQDGLQAADIDPNGTYYIVVDTYTSAYGPNQLTVVEEYEKGVYARDLLAEYVKNGGLD